MTANQPPSAASALADASTIDASIVEYYTDRTGRSSPSQRRPRRRPSTRLTRAMSSSLEKRGSGVRISDVVRISDGYADLLSVGIRISYRWVPRNRVGAFILRSEDRTTNGLWSSELSRVKEARRPTELTCKATAAKSLWERTGRVQSATR